MPIGMSCIMILSTKIWWQETIVNITTQQVMRWQPNGQWPLTIHSRTRYSCMPIRLKSIPTTSGQTLFIGSYMLIIRFARIVLMYRPSATRWYITPRIHAWRCIKTRLCGIWVNNSLARRSVCTWMTPPLIGHTLSGRHSRQNNWATRCISTRYPQRKWRPSLIVEKYESFRPSIMWW